MDGILPSTQTISDGVWIVIHKWPRGGHTPSSPLEQFCNHDPQPSVSYASGGPSPVDGVEHAGHDDGCDDEARGGGGAWRARVEILRAYHRESFNGGGSRRWVGGHRFSYGENTGSRLHLWAADDLSDRISLP